MERKTEPEAFGTQDSENASEEDAFLDGTRQRHVKSRKAAFQYWLPWTIAFVLCLLNVGQFGAYLYYTSSPGSTYETGFSTELASVRSRIKVVTQRFTGGLHFDGKETFSLGGADSPPQYVGAPSPEIDDAWGDLLQGLNFDLTGADAEGVKGETYQWNGQDSYFSGLEVFHSLHCLNYIRRAIYPDYYPDSPPWHQQPSREQHIGHCIDHLRQLIQCHGDLTPMHWELKNTSVILRSDTLRTCRDFGQIQEWARERETNLITKQELVRGERYIVD